MTETSTETKPENGSGDTPKKNVSAAVLKQLDYYFGDYNLPKDRFLKQAIEESEGGWIGLDVMLKFQRLAHITTDQDIIIEAAKGSEILETNADKHQIRRLPSLPIPEFGEEYKKANVAKTVYCKGFEKEKTTLDDLLAFFGRFEGVVNVIKRTWGKEKERHFKGSVFVTFKDKEAAQAFLDTPDVKGPEDQPLVRKFQQQYFDEKDKEYDEKRKARQDKKKETKKAKEALEVKDTKDTKDTKEIKESKEEDKALPTGAILVLEGFKDAETKREDIKEVLKDKFEVNPDEDIAFVYFNKGEKVAKLRFNNQDAAKELAAKIAEGLKEGEKFKVKEDQLEVKVLQGDEEKEFLERCKNDMANQKGKSRRGHKRGGRGGYKGNPKRQRTR